MIWKICQQTQPLIEKSNINQNEKGYSASGTRNVSACIGNKVCPKAQYNTTNFAKRIEKAIFPNDLHFKVALTGCPNDCIKARMHDFGIIGTCLAEYEMDRCVACGVCVKKCKKVSVEALKMENNRIVRDANKCIGCGECVINCPMSAWTRSPKNSSLLSRFLNDKKLTFAANSLNSFHSNTARFAWLTCLNFLSKTYIRNSLIFFLLC